MFPQDPSYLYFLLTHHPRLFRTTLLENRPVPFDPAPDSGVREQYAGIRAHRNLTTGLRELFSRHLLARCLLSPHLDSMDYLCELPEENFTPDVVRQGRWGTVPVVLAGGKKGFIRWFVLGVFEYPCSLGLDGCEKMALPAFEHAKAFVRNISEPGFMCVPVMGPNEFLQVSGDSMTLPLALGFRSLMEKKPIATKLISTGDLEVNGQIRQVGHLDIKARQAAKDFDGLLYPAPSHPPEKAAGIPLIPVSHFNQAWMFARLYSPEHTGLLPILSGVSRDPLFFSLNVSQLPAAWIQWLSDEGRIDTILSQITNNPMLFSHLINSLENLVKNYDLERSRVLCRLISPEKFVKLAARMPFFAVKWTTVRLSLANHQGKILDGLKWKIRGSRLMPHVLTTDVNAAAEFYNHALVADHNRFCFRPDLPENLTRILAFLDKQYQAKKAFGCMTDPVLGRLYGTLMQNCAFCGPDFIQQAFQYSQKARKALGEDTVAEFKPEWLRQYNYLSYAYLEINDVKNAEIALQKYLQITRCMDLKTREKPPSPFEQALLSRFFAHSPNHPETRTIHRLLLQWFNDGCRSQHPWQLISYNLALIAMNLKETDTGLRLFQKSLALCLENRSGPTMIMMALLPLSRLYYLDARPEDLKEIYVRIYSALRFMDQEHFKILKQYDFGDVLTRVFQDPQILFPFTFR